MLQKPLVADTVQHEVGQVHLEALELQKQVAELEEHIGSHWRSRALDQVALARQVGTPPHRPPLPTGRSHSRAWSSADTVPEGCSPTSGLRALGPST